MTLPLRPPWTQKLPLYSHDATTGKPQNPTLEKPTVPLPPALTCIDVDSVAERGVDRF